MPDTKAPAPPPTPAPQSGAPQPKVLADWTFPRLPQPIDIAEIVAGGGGGPGGGPSPSTTAPQMDGAASAGSAAAYSRGDHRHPSDTSRLATAGGTMTGLLTLTLPPTGASHAATKGYVDSVAGAGGTPSDANPAMDSAANPGTATTFARGDHVHPSDTSRLALAGGIMTGMITLPATAPAAANAVRKDYVDGTRTMTGFLTLAGAPTTNNMAATKAYVDAVTSALNALTARVAALEAAGPPITPGSTTWDGGATTWDGGATIWD